jgi:hypothetical protein
VLGCVVERGAPVQAAVADGLRGGSPETTTGDEAGLPAAFGRPISFDALFIPELLRKVISIEPQNAVVQHTLGLLLVRRHEYAEALGLSRWAHELAPDNARYSRVYAIALNSTGAPAEASAIVERAHRVGLLTVPVSIAHDIGDFGAAVRRARELVTSRFCEHAAPLAGLGSQKAPDPLAGTPSPADELTCEREVRNWHLSAVRIISKRFRC